MFGELFKELDCLFDKKTELTNEIELNKEDDISNLETELASVEADISRVSEKINKLEERESK